MFVAGPALGRPADDSDLLKAYARARIAESDGAPAIATEGYSRLLAADPANTILASKTYFHALTAGERDVAVGAATTLYQAGVKDPDIRLLLLAEALRKGDRRGALELSQALGTDEIFAFMRPIIDAWITVDSGKGDPMTFLAEAEANALAVSYAAEQRPLLLLASGRFAEGISAFEPIGSDLRGQRLRVAGASLLSRKGRRQDALTLVQGDGAVLASARSLIERRKRIPGEIRTASAGIAELITRLGGELHRQKVTDLALRFSAVATMMDPQSAEAWIIHAELLAANDSGAEALKALARVPQDDPLHWAAGDIRVRLLAEAQEHERALSEAMAAAAAGEGAGSWINVGNLLMEMERPEEAAEAFGKALALWPGDATNPPWMLHLMRASAFMDSKSWPDAKQELLAAHRLAPEEATVLNHLGYAMLENGEDIPQAIEMIAKASQLEPESNQITDSLGWGYLMSGDTAKAIELLERAAAGEPGDTEINEHLGDAYYRAGRRFEARYAWRAALIQAEGEDAERLAGKIDAGLDTGSVPR